MLQKVTGSNHRVGELATGKLCQPSSKWVRIKLGKDKAEKGEGWVLPSIRCAQDTVAL